MVQKVLISGFLGVILLAGCSSSGNSGNCPELALETTPDERGTNLSALEVLASDDCGELAASGNTETPTPQVRGFGTLPQEDAGSESGFQPIEGDADAGGLYCQAGTTDCLSPISKGVCNDEGTAFVEQACLAGFGCLAGECIENTCVPGHPKGECATSYEFLVCNEGGTQYEPVACDGGLTCYEGECTDLLCVPNSTICYGTGGYKECDALGSGYSEPIFCPEGTQCQNNGTVGVCVDACEANVKANIYLGCEYYAVDLDNVDTAANANVGIVVSVPNDQPKDAELIIRDLATGLELTAAQLQVDSLVIAPGELKTLLLPTTGISGANPLNGSVKIKASFAIASSLPVTVHQFNPLNGEGVYTNDASLLFPSNLGGLEYLVMSWPHRVITPGEEELRGFATIIATEEGNTEVTVVPRSEIAAGVGVPSFLAGESRSFILTQGEVLNLESAGETGADITGTWIRSSQKVTVMSGHECANIPLGVNYCDHLEQQLFPLNTWGKNYVADAYWPRNEKQFDVWRIMGGADETQVTTTPPIPGYETFTVHKGTVVEFQTSESFNITATGPILVGHYMTGSNYPGFTVACTEGTIPSGIGDPALSLGVPTEQYLSSYVVLTPPGYEKNYVNIMAVTGTSLSMDGTPIAESPTPIGTTGYELYRFEVSVGVHAFSGNAVFGLTAYGYDCDVSYAYPGGLKLQALNE